MGHEISQFDIPDRQMMISSAQARMWSDIGEAKITRTIFGRAKVRVIREKDKVMRRWLLAVLAVTVLAIAAWQGWVVLQQSKLLAATPPLSERISVSAPVFHPEILPPATARSSSGGKSESLIQTEIDSLVASPNVRPQRPSSLTAPEPVPAKPAAAQPLAASKTQASSPSATGGPLLNQTNLQPHTRSPTPTPAATPARTAAPAFASPSSQPAANKPAPVAAPAEPTSKKDAPVPSSATGKQTADPANAQAEVNARGTPIIYVQPDDTKPGQ
ncbi:MAG TPA: hypothetical protein VMJ33_10365 [Gallionella sp.]|nr:hypothetical protein [Gallionella sp.]